MDFWEAQRQARKKTTLYLIAFAVITLAAAGVVEFLLREIAGRDYHPPFPLAGFFFIAVTVIVALFQYGQFSRFGGAYVAESVGAHEVSPQTVNPRYRQLLHIVEEISVASAQPMPRVFVIPAKQINAFAAGLSPDQAAVAITEGALEKLNRDEIQGVIAHEFGHIANGDMKISMRLAAMLMGFFFVLYLAMRLFQVSSLRGRGEKGGNPILIAAFLLVVAGALTAFAGSILKAMVSRQREYLADASAVQFTRHPEGIANALIKIGSDKTHDMPASGMAYSHLYLSNYSGWEAIFATHPPLKKRIQAIMGAK